MASYRVYNFLPPRMQPVYQAIADHLSSTLNANFELFVGTTYAEIAQADFAFICGLPYVLRTHRTIPRR